MIKRASRTRLGVLSSVSSSAVFAGVFILAGIMSISASSAFAIRSLFMAVLLLAVVGVLRRGPQLRVLAVRIRRKPLIGLALVTTSLILASQQLLFVWAPSTGRGLPVALGYFIMPIVLALLGRVVFKERLGPWRTAAVAVAAIAVSYQLAVTGGVSWETLIVALGYPAYFVVRRLAGIGGLAGLTAETLLVLPLMIWILATDARLPDQLTDPLTLTIVVAFGVLASVALLLYIGASQLLPLTVFGLLSYLEPLGLALAAGLVLGEALPAQEWPTYIAIGVALVLLALESAWRPKPPRNEPLLS